MLRLAPFERQKVYQLLNYTGGSIKANKRKLKGANAWDYLIRISENTYKVYGNYVDISEEKTPESVASLPLKMTLDDLFNYWEQNDKKKRAVLNTTVIDKLKKDLCLKY